MEKELAIEWIEAQKITFSIDLIQAAKNHLKFLAVVDRNRYLYEDEALKRAINRYNAYWLPMLAKHLEKPLCEEALVVPLDCEWIWHCHRLNPLRYKSDCFKLFGRILGYRNVVSSAQATSTSKTEEIWKKMYPEEPYELDMSRSVGDIVLQENPRSEKQTSYDLLSAVKRQIKFTFQTSRPYMTDDLYLQEAVARYKGFLHIVRYTEKRNITCYCVPTYDVDLMWHTHQLHPDAYCRDLTNAVGRVVHHNDQIEDKSPGNILETGFSQITKQWEETLGKNYWKAGTLKRGIVPTPVTRDPIKFTSNVEGNEFDSVDNFGNLVRFPSANATEVLLEFMEVKNLPEEHKGNVMVPFSKNTSDKLFNTKRSLRISSETGKKQVASIQCETTGEFFFELLSQKSLKRLGFCSLFLEDLMASKTQLSADKWLSLETMSDDISSEPILLHVSVSFTPPTTAPRVFQMAPSISDPKVENAKMCTRVFDQDGKDVFSLYMRSTTTPDMVAKEVYCITSSGEKHILAEFVGNKWCLKGSNGSFKLQYDSSEDDSLFELVGYKMVKLYRGRRLEFETAYSEKQTPERGFLTAVEFSVDYPYGKAVALIDFNSKTVKAFEEWIVVPGITSAILAYDILKEEQIACKGNFEQSISKIDVVSAARCEYMAKMVTNEVEAATCGDCGPCGACGAGDCSVKMMKNEVQAATCGDCGPCGACGAGDCSVKMAKNEVQAATCGDCGPCGACGAGDCSVKMMKNEVEAATCGDCGPCGACGAGDCSVKTMKNEVEAATCGDCGPCGACGAGDCSVKMMKVSEVEAATCGDCGPCGACGAGDCSVKMMKVSEVEAATCGDCGPCGACGAGDCSIKMMKNKLEAATCGDCGPCGACGAGDCSIKMMKNKLEAATCGDCGPCGACGAGDCSIKIAASCGDCGIRGACGARNFSVKMMKNEVKAATCGDCGPCGACGAGDCSIKSEVQESLLENIVNKLGLDGGAKSYMVQETVF